VSSAEKLIPETEIEKKRFAAGEKRRKFAGERAGA